MEDELNTPPLDTELQGGMTDADRIYAEGFQASAEQMQGLNQYINSQTQLEAEQDASIAAALAKDEEPNFISETGAALGGGAVGAVESVGGFAELTGDTLKTGFNTLFGRPTLRTLLAMTTLLVMVAGLMYLMNGLQKTKQVLVNLPVVL